jgi:hypothetical protein
MQAYSPLELKAIKWYADTQMAVPQMSVRPMVRFKIRATGKIVDENITLLTARYKEARAEDVKVMKRLKGQQKRGHM